MNRRYIQKDSKDIFVHKRITLREDTIILPDGSESEYLLYDGLPDAVIVIAVNQKEEVLVNLEYNYPTDSYLYQFPAGTLEPGEIPLEGARRELQEETGIIPYDLTKIGTVLHNYRRSLAKYHFFTTHEFNIKIHAREQSELISNEWISINDFADMVIDNKIEHIGTLAAWSFYVTRRFKNQI